MRIASLAQCRGGALETAPGHVDIARGDHEVETPRELPLRILCAARKDSARQAVAARRTQHALVIGGEHLLARGALVDAGGYSLLFIVLAVLAGAVTGLAACTLPTIVPTRRARSTVAALVRRLTLPSFVQPVLILAVGIDDALGARRLGG